MKNVSEEPAYRILRYEVIERLYGYDGDGGHVDELAYHGAFQSQAEAFAEHNRIVEENPLADVRVEVARIYPNGTIETVPLRLSVPTA